MRWQVLAEQSRAHREQKELYLSKLREAYDQESGYTYRPYVSERSQQLSARSRSRRSNKSIEKNLDRSIHSQLYQEHQKGEKLVVATEKENKEPRKHLLAVPALAMKLEQPVRSSSGNLGHKTNKNVRQYWSHRSQTSLRL